MGHSLVALPTMAGVASDPGGNSRSGGKGTCMAARARHRVKDEGRRKRGTRRRMRGVRGCCGGALSCQVVNSNTSVTWSGMCRSESTHDAHLTVIYSRCVRSEMGATCSALVVVICAERERCVRGCKGKGADLDKEHHM